MNLFPVKMHNRYGYIDQHGNVCIEPRYHYAKEFHNGIAVVWPYKNRLGAIDTTGRLLFEQGIGGDKNWANDFYDNLCLISEEDYDGYETFYFLNKSGKRVIDIDYKSIDDFSEGFAPFAVRTLGSWDFKFGAINTKGMVEIQPEYDYLGRFSEGLATVKINEKYGFINKTGRLVIQPAYQQASNFSGNFAAVKKDNKWGFINKSGSLVISCSYDKVESFAEGYAAICRNAKWGYINTKGEEVIPTRFKEATSNYKRNFSNGLAAFSKNYRWGFIDNNGTVVVEPKYTEVEPFANGLAKVTIGNDYEETNSYIDTTGKTVWSKTEDRYAAYDFDVDYY
jgi:hypothetical protein